MRFLLFHTVAYLILMRKDKIKVFRPAGVARYDLWGQAAAFKPLLQFRQRPLREFIVLCQGIDEAVTAVCSEPDRIPCKQIFVIDQVNHMSPGMAGDKKGFHFNM